MELTRSSASTSVYCSAKVPSFTELFADSNELLFKRLLSNVNHNLHEMLYLHATTVILSIRGSVHAVINIRSLDFAVNCFLMKLCAERLISTLLKIAYIFFNFKLPSTLLLARTQTFLCNYISEMITRYASCPHGSVPATVHSR